MPKGYHHLSYEERCQIEALKKSGLSRGAIAQQLGRDRSTVYREIKRNTGGRGYHHKQAQRMTETRRRAASSVSWRLTPQLCAEVQEQLQEGWRPEQISGRFRLMGRPVGRQRIYDRIHEDRRAGGDL